MVGGGHREANKISHLLRNCHTLCSWVGFLDHLFFNLIAMLTYLSVSTTTSFSSNPYCWIRLSSSEAGRTNTIWNRESWHVNLLQPGNEIESVQGAPFPHASRQCVLGRLNEKLYSPKGASEAILEHSVWTFFQTGDMLRTEVAASCITYIICPKSWKQHKCVTVVSYPDPPPPPSQLSEKKGGCGEYSTIVYKCKCVAKAKDQGNLPRN